MSEQPPVTWSWSRHGLLASCRRAYWYAYLISPQGKDPRASEEIREIWLQRRLDTVPQWIGHLVHEAAEWILTEAKAGRSLDPGLVMRRYETQVARDFRDSEKELWRLRPTKYRALAAHYYGTSIDLDDVQDDVGQRLSLLLDHPVMKRLLEVPQRLVEVEQFQRANIGGVPVFVALDALVRDGRGGMVMIDWKSGHVHHESVRGQLSTYAAYVSNRYPGQRQLIGLAVGLKDASHVTIPLSMDDVRDSVQLIQRSFGDMLSSLSDPIEGFPRRDEDARCRDCAFRRPCGRE